MNVPRLRAPIVLVHGFLGFDVVRLGPWTVFEYFRGIPALLRASGNRVLVARLNPTAGIADRAAQLRRFLNRELSNEPVHLIGHSMGGLDSRFLISRLEFAPRVLSLTTVGTPHRGSPIADWALRRIGALVRPALDLLGVPSRAVDDLTVTSGQRFNVETPDAPGVRYFSVAGQFTSTWRYPARLLLARTVERAEGANDGIVSVASATWGESCEVWDADHLGLVNWPWPHALSGSGPERLAAYARLVQRLADEGF